MRKSTTIPYAAHLLGVASLVLEAGGTETEAIAALLHDAVEDQGGAERLADITARFGADVAGIVLECSAEDKTDDPGWRTRKGRYIAQLGTSTPSAVLVSLADKLYNARAILDDYRAIGNDVWDRFGADDPKADSILWYYRSLIDAYQARGQDAPRRLLAEFERTIGQLERLRERPNCPRCGAGDVRTIAYGLMTEEGAREADEEDMVLGGCCIDVDGPSHVCAVCDHEFADQDHAPW